MKGELKTELSRCLGFLFVLMIFLSMIVFPASSSPATTMYLDPSNFIFNTETNGTIGNVFNVSVRVDDVTDLAAWQVCIVYNDSIINVTRWFEPTWDSEYVFHGKGTLPVPYPPEYEYVSIAQGNGSALVSAALFPAPSPGGGFTGDGILCIMEFNITAVPSEGEVYSCELAIDKAPPYDSFLLDPPGDEIPYEKENGYYEIRPPGPAPPEPPIADFTWSPTKPQENQTVTFDASLSTPDGGNIVSYTWDFGDGSHPVTESDPTTTHNYTKTGAYPVTLNVTDDEGMWDIESKTITVRPPVTTDVNDDGFVDWKDIWETVKTFGRHPDHPRWNSAADVDYNGRVDIRDIYYIIIDFGE